VSEKKGTAGEGQRFASLAFGGRTPLTTGAVHSDQCAQI